MERVDNPKISVITPLFNARKTIKKTMLSVLGQTFKEFEFIIVDDGSTDDSVSIVKSFDDDRIVLLQQKNAGASAARNHGIRNARADVIAFIDSDDLWHPNRLEHDYELFVNSEFDEKVLLTNFYMMNPDYEIVHFPPVQSFNGMLRDVKYFHPYFYNPGASMMNKSVIEKVGYFNDKSMHHEDYEFALRLIDNFPFIYSKERLFYYLYDMNSKSKRSFDEYDYSKSHLAILDKFFATTKNEYSQEFIEQAREQCLRTQIFSLLSLKNNIKDSKKLYEEELHNKKAFACSARGLCSILSFVLGINLVLFSRLVIQNLYRIYFKYIRRIRINDLVKGLFEED